MPKPSLSLVPGTSIEVKAEPKLITSAKLDTQLAEYMATCAKFDQFKAKKEKQAEEIKKQWHARHGKKLQTEDFLSTEVDSHSSNISKELLLKAGVKVSTIVKCTKQTPYSFVKVTRKRDVKV